jgi:hypothetical protein
MTRSTVVLYGVIVALVAGLTREASAQTFAGRVSIEPRVGLALPTGDFGDSDPTCPVIPGGGPSCPYPIQTGAKPGWRWTLRAHYTLNTWLGVFAGYGQARFKCAAALCFGADKPKTQGFEAGFKAVVIPLGSMTGWVEGAGTYERVSIVRTLTPEGERQSLLVDYGGATGLSLGVGAELPLRGTLDLTFSPSVRFRLYDADPPSDHPDMASVPVRYALFELGFRYIFGR